MSEIKGKIAIIDYGMGNHTSIMNALDHLGYDSFVTDKIDLLKKAKILILPGVGAFGEAMKRITAIKGLAEFLKDYCLVQKKPMMGICLGMQLLADRSSEHGQFEGLGIIPGEVIGLEAQENVRVPHVGWNAVRINGEPRFLFNGIETGDDYYFVHSYRYKVQNKKYELCSTSHGLRFTSVIMRDNVIGVQFHPEKSQKKGLQLIKNFIEHYDA